MNDITTEDKEVKAGPLGGERLRIARRAKDISVADIAKELHLDEPKVRALEKNEFDVLGAPVFAKGHLRKYAELVGVAIDDVMSDYYHMNRSTGAPPVVGLVKKRATDIALGPWIGAAFAALIVMAAAYWWFTREPAAPATLITPAALAPFESDQGSQPTVAGENLAVTTDPERDEEALAEPVDRPVVQSSEQTTATDTAPIVSAPAADPASTAPQVQMSLTYSGDCWTEVSDGSGRRLYYDLGQTGRVINLSGDAPLRVILGDSANVRITVDGRDYPIPTAARSGRLARLNINSQ